MTTPQDTLDPERESAPGPPAPPDRPMTYTRPQPTGSAPESDLAPAGAPMGAATPGAPVRRARTGPEQTRRVMMFAFGLVQVLIGLRIVLVLISARQDNALVGAIIDTSEPLVAPFQGILQSNVFESGAIVLDLAAVVALIGWTIFEAMLYWAIGLFRRDAA